MNVDDISEEVIPSPEDRLAAIFIRQAELMEKYEGIEAANGFKVLTPPVDLHDRFGQARLKDFTQRFSEEVSEAMKAHDDHPDNPTHLQEELSDAYHFFIELCILADFSPIGLTSWTLNDYEEPQLDDLCSLINIYTTIIETYPQKLDLKVFSHVNIGQSIQENYTHTLNFYAWESVRALHTACNCLKQKPWKNTHVLTDIPLFSFWVGRTHERFIKLAWVAGLNADELFRIYFKKSEVNKFRQETNY